MGAAGASPSCILSIVSYKKIPKKHQAFPVSYYITHVAGKIQHPRQRVFDKRLSDFQKEQKTDFLIAHPGCWYWNN